METVTFSRPRIIEDADWIELCKKRVARKKTAKKNLKHEYLCRDFIICAECGIKLAVRPKHSKRHYKTGVLVELNEPIFYYACSRKKKVSGFQCSGGHYHHAPIVDDLIWRKVKQYILKPELLKAIEKSADHSKPVNINGLQEQTKHIEEKQKTLEVELARARSLVVKGLFSETDFTEEKNKIETERKQLEKAQQALQFEIQSFLDAQKKYETLDLSKIIEKYRERIEVLDFDERQALTKTLIKSVVISKDGGMHLSFRHVGGVAEV